MILKSLIPLIGCVCFFSWTLTDADGQIPPLPDPPLFDFAEDFEVFSTSVDSPSGSPQSEELGADRWLVNGIAWAGATGDFSGFQFFYGNFTAPNFDGNAGFSGIVANQGTGAQGVNHFNIFSDYNQGAAHSPAGNNSNWVETRVFREQVIGPADLGTTWAMDFEYKRNFEFNTETMEFTDFGPNGNTETLAFIRVQDSNDPNFPTLGETNLFTTTLGQLEDWTAGQVAITIDPAWDGLLLSFGFSVRAQNSANSGMLYDNVSFAAVSDVLIGDVSLDGTVDLLDVAPFVDLILNGGFQDEADINRDGVVDLLDVAEFVALILG